MTKPAFHLRPRARLLHTIGSELISSESVAVVELVKNSYDADARHVLLRFSEPQSEDGGLQVLDDGSGMGRETVEGVWLDIATPHRTSRRTSPGGRRVLGEKGIGRFAAARLAHALEMISRTPGSSTETHVRVDWRQFKDPELFLDEVELEIMERPAHSFSTNGMVTALWDELSLAPSTSGTLLNLNGLTRPWAESDFASLRRDLSRLVRPRALEVPADFEIHLHLPSELEHLSGPIEPPAELSNPPYVLTANVREDGQAEINLTLPGRDTERRYLEVDRARRLRDEGGRLLCGPLDLELRVFDRDREALSRLEVSGGLPISTRNFRHLLDQLAGVSVYRDGFRVLPFGERGDDWLNLDARRVNNPTQRLSNSQIIGSVAISSKRNPQLRDQTNREGLIQGEAYDALRGVVLDILVFLENERFSQRRENDSGQRVSTRGRGLFASLSVKDVVAAVRASPQSDAALVRLVERADERVSEGVERVRDVLARYQRLATLGKLVDEVVHDGQSSVGRIRRATRDARKLLRRGECRDQDAAADLVSAVDAQGEFLGTLFRRIAPFGGRKRGRPRKVSAKDTVMQAVEVLSSTAARAGAQVVVTGANPEITVDPAEMQELIINLLDNALYWVQHVPAGMRRVEIRIDRPTSSSLTITVDDSGPGVPESLRDTIFDAYFSSKPDGGGLGLSIVGELIADAYDGRLALVESDLGGAAFQLTFNRRVG